MTEKGWYQDPSRRHELRWFDGEHWTTSVSDAGRTSHDDPGAPAAETRPVDLAGAPTPGAVAAPAKAPRSRPPRRGLSGCAIAAIVGGVLAAILVVIVIVAVVAGVNSANKALHRNDTAATLTLAKFNAIQPGMTVDQVNKIVGGPGKLQSETNIGGHHDQIFMWTGQDLGANGNVTFDNNVVVSKAQFGLR